MSGFASGVDLGVVPGVSGVVPGVNLEVVPGVSGVVPGVDLGVVPGVDLEVVPGVDLALVPEPRNHFWGPFGKESPYVGSAGTWYLGSPW